MSRDCTSARAEATGRLIGPCNADVFEAEHTVRSSSGEQRIEEVSESGGMRPIYEGNARSPTHTTSTSHESNDPWTHQISKIRDQLQSQTIAQNQRGSAEMATDDRDNLYKQHFDLQGRRGEIIDTRFDLIGQRSALQDHISTFQQAEEELLAQVKALSTDDQTALSSAIASIQRSRDSLSQQLGQTQALEKSLNKLEYKFGKEENEFFGSLRAALPALLKAAQAPTASPSPAANLTPSETLEEIRKTTLQAFYDKSSDVPILEERLVELDHTFDSERGHRETRTTLGQPILPPDLEFYTQYRQDRESLQAELAQTRSEVNRLQARCVQLGLIPPPPTPPNINDDIAGVSKQVPPKARSWVHSSESGKHLEYSFVSDGHQMPKLSMPKLPNFANPRDRINQWITEARDTAEPPDAPGSGNSSGGQHPQSASGSEANNDSLLGAASRSESRENVDESQLGQKRSMSQSSEVLEPSHSDEQPPQKSPKQS